MTGNDTLLYLSKADMAALPLSAADMVDAIERLSRGREAGTVHNAPKSALKPDADRFFMSTLSVSDDPPLMAVKSLGVSAGNAARGLESIGALITLFDGVTGHPVAILDGDWVTAFRTAALSALAARFMARPGSRTIAFIGCGLQARSHLDLFGQLYPLTEIRAFGRGAANRDALCKIAGGMGLSAVAAPNAENAVRGADIIVSSVPGHTDLVPFLKVAWLAPGSYAAMVDLARSWQPDGIAGLERIVIDDLPQEKTMPEPMVPTALVAGDLQDLVAGRIPGRDTNTERTAFAFRGLAIGDLALAAAAYARAVEDGIGTRLPR